ncbi:hypothetical protein TNCV_1954661 [Trichonephila clavipes]|nr:hypothetical protein TNCV_1954661 [Trichonephila clavipes]
MGSPRNCRCPYPRRVNKRNSFVPDNSIRAAESGDDGHKKKVKLHGSKKKVRNVSSLFVAPSQYPELPTATAGSDVVQSGRPIFDDFFQHLWPYIGNNTANVVFQMVKRLWLIRMDQ